MQTLDQIHEAVNRLETASPWAFVLAALAGLLLVVTPSVLAMIPAVMGYIAAEPGIRRWTAATRSLAFVLGTATTFGSYGLVFGWAGAKLAPLFGANGYLIAGIVLILLGAVLLAKLKVRLPMIRLPERKVSSALGAYALGLPFGLVGSACPCSMPVVLALLLYAGSVGSAWFGAALLFVFALVRGFPLVLAGTFTGLLKDLRGFARWRPLVEKASGVLLVGLGVFFVAQRFL
ncbi:MAG: cytochrome c biogenesis protein CcdA [Planctomycetes bacterium]|nr:cytochrome c biogenesis protein CcdA [Planctomycetota bacterium]